MQLEIDPTRLAALDRAAEAAFAMAHTVQGELNDVTEELGRLENNLRDHKARGFRGAEIDKRQAEADRLRARKAEITKRRDAVSAEAQEVGQVRSACRDHAERTLNAEAGKIVAEIRDLQEKARTERNLDARKDIEAEIEALRERRAAVLAPLGAQGGDAVFIAGRN